MYYWRDKVEKLWLVVVVLAGALAAPPIQAQESVVDPTWDGETPETSQFGVLVGMRGEFTGLTSPGASLDLMLHAAGTPIWVSAQFLAQVTRWYVDYYDHVRRNHNYSGRIRMGYGRRRGPAVYALLERGQGFIVSPDNPREDTFSIVSAGLGVAWTIGRVTASVEGGLGRQTRYGPERHRSLGVSLQYQLLRTDLR